MLMMLLMILAIIIGSLLGTFGMLAILRPRKKLDKEYREAHNDLMRLMADHSSHMLNRDDLVRLFDHEYRPLDWTTYPDKDKKQ